MESTYLIFPMVLSDNQFKQISDVISNLSKMSFNKLTSLPIGSHDIIYYLAKAIIDLEEVIRNKNSRGYRYNSYILNLAALKLSFIAELIEKKYLHSLINEHLTIMHSINLLKQILSDSYQQQKED